MKNFFAALSAVLSAFVGIRKSDSRPSSLRPLHYVFAGLAAVAIFIALLLAAVHSVV